MWDVWCGVVTVMLLVLPDGADAQDEGCYSSGSVAGIVIATVVVTLVTGVLAAAFIWYLWMQKKGGFGDEKTQEKGPPVSSDKQTMMKEHSDYAFDNPYFKDDEAEKKNINAAEKGESGFRLDNGSVTPLQNAKAAALNGTSNGQHKKSLRPFSSLPFHAVFHPSGKKQKGTVDDIYITKHLERMTVPLRGVDFTGLGFNICGNMRDGIFVKDVLHRGPATESGKIKAGDRIVGVTVSFAGMVYEDALTILSYASPYEVKLEIEKGGQTVCPTIQSAGTSPKRLGQGSTSFRSTQGGKGSLFHPLYRSQSIDDLTKIGKDGFISGNSPASKSKEPSKDPTPKRSQSVEASNGGLKARISAPIAVKSDESKSTPGSKDSRKSSTSSCGSAGKTLDLEKSQAAPPNSSVTPFPCTKKEVKSSRFRVEQNNVKSEAPAPKHAPPVKPVRDTTPVEEKQGIDTVDHTKPKAPVIRQTATEVEDLSVVAPQDAAQSQPSTEAGVDISVKPLAPPRKTSNHAKRRAPAPPPNAPPSNATYTKTETSAVVHRSDDDEEPEQEPEVPLQEDLKEDIPPPPPTSELPDYPSAAVVSGEKTSDLTSSNSSLLASGGLVNSNQTDSREDQSPGKRKASSLGDLTKLEQGKKASESSAILERAVSMDLQQSIPGENLVKQKKILKAPTFEDECDEDIENDSNEPESTGLKRWDNGLGLANGDEEPNENLSKEITPSVDKEIKGASLIMTSCEVTATSPTRVEVKINDSNGVFSEQEKTSEMFLTSTPVRKIIEIKNFVSDELRLDDLSPGKQHKEEDSPTKHPRTSSSSIPVLSPVTISIPVIKPDMTQFEKLPSPPPASTHPDASWRVTKISTTDDSGRIQPLERISVQSLYRPIFNSKESVDEAINESTSSSKPDDSSVSVKVNESSESFEKLNESTNQPNFSDSSIFWKFNESSESSEKTNEPSHLNDSSISWKLIESSKISEILNDSGISPLFNESTTVVQLNDSSSTRDIFGESKRPVKFTESKTIVTLNETPTEKLMNGNTSDSSEHYSTAQENSMMSSFETNNNSTFSVTLSPSVINNVTVKTPNSVAGFAKTLITPGPIEVDNLLSLAAEPNTPPPQLESPPKPVEND